MSMWLMWRVYKNALTKKKSLEATTSDSKLLKFLTTLDLTALSIGSTLGVGVYVLAGDVAKNHAGPAVVVSFLIAAIASLFAGLCFAEFGTRVPRAGSSYIYTYVTIGELLAFIIGWALILEYMIGAASVVRGLSSYIDEFNNNTISNAFRSIFTIEINYISPYVDFLAFGITVTFSVALALGAKESSLANNICTLINLTIVLFVIVSGLFKADIANWKINVHELPKNDSTVNYGSGGFAPFGVMGILSGAGECFYGFIGFDCIATAGEEAKNPKKSLPMAIVASLGVVLLAYFGISAILTTVLPYYDQNTNAPFIYMYESLGWHWATYVVSVGAICGLTASLVGSLFPLPRIIYAMASDGLLYHWLGNINPRFQTPLVGTMLAGVLTGTIAALFDISHLSNMMSLGTLFSYSIVAACVLILRYKSDEPPERNQLLEEPITFTSIAKQFFNANNLVFPTNQTSKMVSYLVTVFVVVSFLSAGYIRKFGDNVMNKEEWAIIVLVILILIMVVLIVGINGQPKSQKVLPFSTWLFVYLVEVKDMFTLFYLSSSKTPTFSTPWSDESATFVAPLVPFLPAASIFINFNLMWGLKAITWAQFGAWMVIGLVVYFTYGIKNSIRTAKQSIAEDNKALEK